VLAGDVLQVPVRCTVHGTGCISGLLRLESNQQISFIPIYVQSVAPAVCVMGGMDVLELGTIYAGVPVKREIQLCNTARVPAKWHVRDEIFGQGCESIKVKVDPCSGEIAFGETQAVCIEVVALSPMALDSLLVFDIEHAKDPLVIAVQATAHGMSVQYSVQTCSASQTELQGGEIADEWTMRENARLQACLDQKLVDFGNMIAVGDTVELVMTVSNDTAIEAMVDLRVLNFAAREHGGDARGLNSRADTGGSKSKRMLLSDQHEVMTPFRTPAGNNILRNRRAKVSQFSERISAAPSALAQLHKHQEHDCLTRTDATASPLHAFLVQGARMCRR
jgi:hypothetical protein